MDALTATDADDLLSFLATVKSAPKITPCCRGSVGSVDNARATNKDCRPIAIAIAPQTPPPLDHHLPPKQHQKAKKARKQRLCLEAMKSLTGTPLLDALPTYLRRNRLRLRQLIHARLRLNMIRRGRTPPGCTLQEVFKSGRWRGMEVVVEDVRRVSVVGRLDGSRLTHPLMPSTD